MDIQELFDRVVASGNYHPHYGEGMCIAIERCRNKGILTRTEWAFLGNAIRHYIKTLDLSNTAIYLDNALAANNLPHKAEDCLAIYKDWENRPIPE